MCARACAARCVCCAIVAVGCVRSTNQAEFALGPFGSWRVAIRGSWLPAGQQQPSDTVLVRAGFNIKVTKSTNSTRLGAVEAPQPRVELHVKSTVPLHSCSA